ncbi:uncharacterized protein G2W53_036761 [Senna tora]|uniref:Uncharacterized protein n=1 Tax=Senna tora TaxID=362788 RepID=A0A834W6D3_9FABA|nr:uncharacterized protein G2W53_036761 [Senna tora]
MVGGGQGNAIGGSAGHVAGIRQRGCGEEVAMYGYGRGCGL